MYDSVAVSLKLGSVFTRSIGIISAFGIAGEKGIRRQSSFFSLTEDFGNSQSSTAFQGNFLYTIIYAKMMNNTFFADKNAKSLSLFNISGQKQRFCDEKRLPKWQPKV